MPGLVKPQSVIHGSAVRDVKLSVKRWLVLSFVCLAMAAAADPKLDQLLHAVEQRYNRAQTLTLSFTQTYSASRRPSQTESGVLALRKPGRMRWDYASPAGKFFLSDGKAVYLFSPEERRVEKSSLKESEDTRAPLAFLLGKLNFYKEFKRFSLRPDGGNTWIVAEPNSDTLPYSQVEFLVTPQAQIRRVRVTAPDHSVIDYAFDQEKLNPPLKPELFAFRLPAGSQLVEGER